MQMRKLVFIFQKDRPSEEVQILPYCSATKKRKTGFKVLTNVKSTYSTIKK